MNKKQKGQFCRSIVRFSIAVISGVLLWAVVLTTVGAVFGWQVSLDPVLTFAGAFFGGELTLLAFKRIFAKESKNENIYSEIDQP